MKALQLHYTSCRAGQLGSAGFQVRAFSPGLQPEERREVERRGVYRPPDGAPPNPSDEELELDRHFPRALRSYRLSSGRRALTVSHYAGRDYTGRWGNFFAHTLVLADPDAVPRHWPVDYAEWPGWVRRLDPDADGDEAPAPLEVVELGAIEPAESYRLEELQAFVRERPDGTAWLVRMARALLTPTDERRPLVIRAPPLDGIYWLAALVKLLPPDLVWDLSLSTYQYEARGVADLNLTVEGTEFTFDPTERRYRFQMFAPDEEAVEVGAEDTERRWDYAEIAVGWLVERPETLLEFFDFLERLGGVGLDPRQLRGAAHLFVAGEPSAGRLLLCRAIASPGIGPGSPELPELARAFEGIDGTAYHGFLELFLTPALNGAISFAEHGQTVHAVFVPEHVETFVAAYRRWFRQPAGAIPLPALRSALEARHDPPSVRHPLPEALVEATRDDLLDALIALPGRDLERLGEELTRREALRPIWRRLRRRVGERRDGAGPRGWRRLKKLVGG